MFWIDDNSSWTLHAPGREGGAMRPTEVGHLDLIEATLDPVQVFRDPVDRQTFGGRQADVHH